MLLVVALDGSVSAVWPATDVSALGCLLCELVTGAPPYTGTTEQVL